MRRSSPLPIKRIQVDMTPTMKATLESLRDRCEMASYSEVIRKAIQLLDRTVLEQQKNGRQLGYLLNVNGEWEFQEVIVLT